MREHIPSHDYTSVCISDLRRDCRLSNLVGSRTEKRYLAVHRDLLRNVQQPCLSTFVLMNGGLVQRRSHTSHLTYYTYLTRLPTIPAEVPNDSMLIAALSLAVNMEEMNQSHTAELSVLVMRSGLRDVRHTKHKKSA